MSDRSAFIWLVLIGVVYSIVVEQHSAMRFAWLRQKEGAEPTGDMDPASRLIFIAYNAIWWVPVVLGVLKFTSYRSALIGFLVITTFRALANLYRNNVLPVEAGRHFPLRSP